MSSGLRETWTGLLLTSLLMGLAAWWLSRGDRRRIMGLSPSDSFPWLALLWTPLIGWASMSLMQLVDPGFLPAGELQTSLRATQGAGWVVTITLVALLAPAGEELLFRGALQGRLWQSLGPSWGVLLPALGFALLHGSWKNILVVLPMGIWLGFLRFRSESLWPPLGAHALNNSLFLVSLSPQAPSTGALSWPLAAGILGLTGVRIVSGMQRVEEAAGEH